MSGLTANERRKYKRLRVNDRTAAVTIANKAYPIIEMSSGGFSSRGLADNLSITDEHPTYILLHGLSLLNNVSVQLAWQGDDRTPPSDSRPAPNIGFKFSGLGASQKLQLEAFLKWHTEPPELKP